MGSMVPLLGTGLQRRPESRVRVVKGYFPANLSPSLSPDPREWERTMREKPWFAVVVFVVAAVVAAAAVAESIREHSLNAIWTVGWLPAALMGALARPRHTRPGRRRRSRR